MDGFQFIPTLIGLFAVSEVIAGVERIIRGEEHEQKSNEKITNVLPDWKTIKKIWPNILSGGLIGTFIGAIPGAGGDIAVFVSYGASKSASINTKKSKIAMLKVSYRKWKLKNLFWRISYVKKSLLLYDKK